MTYVLLNWLAASTFWTLIRPVFCYLRPDGRVWCE